MYKKRPEYPMLSGDHLESKESNIIRVLSRTTPKPIWEGFHWMKMGQFEQNTKYDGLKHTKYV